MSELLFLASAAFLLYAIAGYPLLLAVLARFPAPPVRRRPEWRKVTVLLPVRDGERWIRAKLESLLALDYPRELLEVIVISDGSEDRTDEMVREFAPAGVRLLRNARAGKPSALNSGMEQASGEILFFTDVRQPLDPGCLRHLVECLADPSVGVACGEMVILAGQTREEANVGLYWRYEKWIRRQLNRASSLLVVTGCVYAMRRELAAAFPPEILIDDAYQPIAAQRRGYRVYFEERARAYDYPTALEAEFPRKLRTLAGLYQLVKYFPGLLIPLRRISFHFLSYKFARLLLPYSLILLAASSAGLPDPYRAAAMAGQVAFYGLAAADPWIAERRPWKRLSSLARTFVVLMLAAFCAGAVLVVPPARMWGASRVAKREKAGREQ